MWHHPNALSAKPLQLNYSSFLSIRSAEEAEEGYEKKKKRVTNAYLAEAYAKERHKKEQENVAEYESAGTSSGSSSGSSGGSSPNVFLRNTNTKKKKKTRRVSCIVLKGMQEGPYHHVQMQGNRR